MRQIVLDNPPSASTALLLERMRAEAKKTYKKVRRKAKQAVKKFRKRKSSAKKSKPSRKGKIMAKSKKHKKHGKKGHKGKKHSKRSGSSKKRGSSSRGKRGKRKGGKGKRRKSANRIIVIGRRVRVRKGSILNMNPFKIKSLISRENLVTAGGVVAASIVTRFVATELAKRKIALPLAAQYPTAANAVYNLAIPVLGAALTRRFSPALARGMIFGGLAASISSLITSFNTSSASTKAAGRYMREYLDPVRSTGAYLAPRRAASVPMRSVGAYSGFNAWA